MDDIQLRRIIIEELIREEFGDFGGGDWGSFGGGYDPWPGDVAKTFIQPFTDVFKTAKAAVEDVTSKGQAFVETAIQAVPTLVFPFVAAEYGKIKRAEADRYEKIQRKYADVLKRNEEAFKGDAAGIAFMLAPAHYLATTLVAKSAKPLSKSAAAAMLRVVDTVSSRADPVVAATNKARQLLGLEEGFEHGRALLEKAKQPPTPNEVVTAIVKLPAVQQALKDSDVLAQLEDDARAMMGASLSALTKLAEKVKAAGTLEQLEQTVGKDLSNGLKKLPDEDRPSAAAAILSQAKGSILGMVAKQLSQESEWLLKQGVDAKHPLVLAYKRTLASVKGHSSV